MEGNKKIGALWTKKTRNGGEFYTGSIELEGKQTRIVIWPTREKKTEKSPDYTIQLDTWEPTRAQAPAEQPAAPADFNDDIPF